MGFPTWVRQRVADAMPRIDGIERLSCRVVGRVAYALAYEVMASEDFLPRGDAPVTEECDAYARLKEPTT
jgi:hypothetical protein